MRTDLFDFDLPPERIALRPVSPRDAARLLVVRPVRRRNWTIPGPRPADLLRPGDALVVNDTRVIPARLSGRRIGRGEPSRQSRRRCTAARWVALAGVRQAGETAGRRRPRAVRHGGTSLLLGQLDATVEEKGEGGEVTLAFTFHGAVLDQALEERGDMPLPPYIASRRPADEHDRADYQTMFALAGRLGRGTDRRAAFHAGAGCGVGRRAGSRCIR